MKGEILSIETLKKISYLEKENKKMRSILEQIEKLLDQYSWNAYYYKCDSRNKYYKSEIINDLKELLEKGGWKNER